MRHNEVVQILKDAKAHGYRGELPGRVLASSYRPSADLHTGNFYGHCKARISDALRAVLRRFRFLTDKNCGNMQTRLYEALRRLRRVQAVFTHENIWKNPVEIRTQEKP